MEMSPILDTGYYYSALRASNLPLWHLYYTCTWKSIQNGSVFFNMQRYKLIYPQRVL